MNQTQKYYEEQLKFLREQSKVFAAKHPKLAPFLSEGDIDPDIERLLEGFAFISGKLHQKIDDAYPEVSEQLLEFIAPNYLKPLPSCTVLEFVPKASQANQKKIITRGTAIDSVKDKARYFFTTCYDTEVLPMHIKAVHTKREQDELILRLDFEMLAAANLPMLPEALRLYCASDLSSAYWWYYLLLKQLNQALLYVDNQIIPLKNLIVAPVGLTADESLLPFATDDHQVTQHLLEYYAFPEKFMFVDLKNIPWHKAPYVQNFSLEFYLKVPPRLKLTADEQSFKINCTPVMNIWQDHAAPITHDHRQSRYLVDLAEQEFKAEVHSVLSLDAWSYATRDRYDYTAAYRCPYPARGVNRYQVYLEEDVVQHHPQVYLELWEDELKNYDKIIVSPKILAYQPEAFLQLQQGEVVDNNQSLLNCSYKNVSSLSMPVYPPLGRTVSWHLLCYLALQYKNLDELENIKTLLIQHDFMALHGDRYQGMGQKLAESLHAVQKKEMLRFYKGEALRGFKSILSVKDEVFLNRGELFLFGTLLAKILEDRSAFNSFHELEIKELSSGMTQSFPSSLAYDGVAERRVRGH